MFDFPTIGCLPFLDKSIMLSLLNPIENKVKGILFILLGMAFFSIQDALIKFIYEDAALYELYFGRTFVALILLVAYLKLSKQNEHH